MEEPVRTLVSHQSWLRRLARRLVRSPAAADDLVQDTCVTALHKAPPGADMRPWLRGVMRHLASHYVRGERRRIVREESYHRATDSITAPDGLLDYGVDRERLREMVDALPEPFRSTVVQRYLEGLSCAEIARAERVPAGTVRWRQSRALELLRARLEGGSPEGRPRRRHQLHWWPFAGVGQSLMAAGSSLLPLPGRNRAVWLGLAGLVAIIALGFRIGADEAVPDARASADSLAGRPASPSSSALADEIDGAGPDAQGTSARRRRDQDPTSSGGRAGRPGASGGSDEDSWLERLMDEYEQALYDCEIDRDRILRCVRGAVGTDVAGVATCRLLVRSLGVIDVARRQGVRSAHSVRFLATASAANLSLARKLGCAFPADPDQEAESPAAGRGAEPRADDQAAETADDRGDGEPTEGEPAGEGQPTDEGQSGPDSQPTCESQEGEGGDECTTCTDGSGSDTFCGPVECNASLRDDGAVCTTCSDGHGHVETTCSGGTWQSGCESVVQEHGLLCSTCPGDGASPPECLVARCHVIDGCLECRDPKGRVGTDCSIDYEVQSTGSVTVGGGDTFNQCSASWGFPGGGGATCHYPGTETCTMSEGGGARCIDCRFPGGGATSLCMLDPSYPTPDPMAGRPSWLPAPGTCVTETRGSGMQCTTCTANDLRSTISCRFPRANQCGSAGRSDPRQSCVRCRLGGGAEATLCELSGPS